MNKRVKTGLALGAGAARGLAHIGVLEVLEEHRIPIDYISGCSMGAVIGCLFALGIAAKEIHSLAAGVSGAEFRKLFDITIPRTGLIRGNHIEKLMDKLTSSCNFSQLKIPFVAVSACLEDGKLHVFNSGKVTDAVRASISIPGVFEPVLLNGKTYVDGGVLVRVPVDTVRNMGADIVIAVDVGYFGGFRPSPKNIIDIMIYSFELQQWEGMRGRPTGADITISPDTSSINPAVFNRVEDCVELGRVAALSAMDELKQLLDRDKGKPTGPRGLVGF